MRAVIIALLLLAAPVVGAPPKSLLQNPKQEEGPGTPERYTTKWTVSAKPQAKAKGPGFCTGVKDEYAYLWTVVATEAGIPPETWVDLKVASTSLDGTGTMFPTLLGTADSELQLMADSTPKGTFTSRIDTTQVYRLKPDGGGFSGVLYLLSHEERLVTGSTKKATVPCMIIADAKVSPLKQ